MSEESAKNVSRELRTKANEFLNSRSHASNLVEIIGQLEVSVASENTTTALKFQDAISNGTPSSPTTSRISPTTTTKPASPTSSSVSSAMLALEVIFVELLKRGELNVSPHPKNATAGDDDDVSKQEAEYRKWLLQRYKEALRFIEEQIAIGTIAVATQALVTSMKLLAAESKYAQTKLHGGEFPKEHLRRILLKIATAERSQTALLERFKEYSQYLDIVFHSWNLMQNLVTRAAYTKQQVALNYVELIGVLPMTKTLYEEGKTLCYTPSEDLDLSKAYNYLHARKWINRVWQNIADWSDGVMTEVLHKQILIVLLERILPHLENPILLTDFLMDSLNRRGGGPISLLALQGMFVLMHKHNITYPNVYEKLYKMFEPKIFLSKYKARLFYLADIFLSSTHLPESLVAAFVKRLARLSLTAPPQDIVIMLQFIGNLIIRHRGLKQLVAADAAIEVASDPYNDDERDPVKSNALQSSLWEIVALQKHAIPSVATAARFISQPLPTIEWNLGKVVDVTEKDIFYRELSMKKPKLVTLAYQRPSSMFLPEGDRTSKYWQLF